VAPLTASVGLEARAWEPRVDEGLPQTAAARWRAEDGLGLIEVTVTMFVIAIALAALLAVFASSATSLTHSGRVGTATVLAEQQLELYRGMTYCSIALTGGAGAVTGTDATYTSDPAYPGAGASVTYDQTNTNCATAPGSGGCQTSALASPPPLNSCTGVQTITGPDNAGYRIDTYVTPIPAVANVSREYKKVTVVARTTNKPPVVAREVSTFDPSTGR
jgi:type II secretory pathway pseudopilin PulG